MPSSALSTCAACGRKARYSKTILKSKKYKVWLTLVEQFRIYYRPPYPIHSAFLCNGWDTHKLPVYKIPENDLGLLWIVVLTYGRM
jgi:hypothetical protein